MSILANYTEEEKRLLIQGPRLGAIVISAASPGHASETAAEGFAAIEYAMTRRAEFVDNRLIQSLLFELDELAKGGQRFQDYSKLAVEAGALEKALGQLGQIADLLDAKADPEEAVGYKRWVMNAATAASDAGKEGGNFLGWGAVAVNDAERDALAEMALRLRIAD